MIDFDDFRSGGKSERSPRFNRSVLEAQAELSQLVAKYGGSVTRIFTDEGWEDRRDLERWGWAHWDAGQLPDVIQWVIDFAAAGGGAVGAWKFLKGGQTNIKRLMTLAGLNHITLKAGGLSLDVTGATNIDEVCERFEKLANDPNIQAHLRRSKPAGVAKEKKSGKKPVAPVRKSAKKVSPNVRKRTTKKSNSR
jgi:hypothetical protein